MLGFCALCETALCELPEGEEPTVGTPRVAIVGATLNRRELVGATLERLAIVGSPGRREIAGESQA